MESIVEHVIKQHITGLNDIDLASRRAKEAATRRYEAAAWLRRTVGVVGAKDLAEEPSEEEFRIGIRNGIILCNAINKVLPGAIPKVVDVPVDLFSIPEGAPLSAYQYFENVRNFLVTLQSMGLPSFEASDLEKGGKSSRVVDSVLALKSYIECKQQGKNGSFKFGGITRPGSFSVSHFIRKNSYPFMNCTSRAQILSEKPIDELSLEDSLSGNFLLQSAEMSSSHSLNMLVRKALSNKKLEEVPLLVETMLNKVMQEFERRIANNNEMMDVHENDSKITEEESKVTEKAVDDLKENCLKQQLKESFQESYSQHQLRLKCIEEKENMERFSKQHAKELKHTLFKEKHIKQQIIFDRQQTEIQKLKCVLQLTKSDMKDMKSHCLEEFENLGNQLHALANAASGYYKVLEENRKLYNQIQDLKGNIRVYCRVRPFLPGSKVCIIDFMDDQNITISSPLKASKDACRTFVFNKVFGPSASQEEVFSDTQPLIRSVLDGYNVCIFAYGQTGSGKTYTMNGPKELNEKSMGVNYRALNDLFYLSDMRKDTVHYEISVQMLEIYNEQVRDLLNDGLSKKLEIRNSSNKGYSVPDANLIPVRSTKEVIEIMSLGHKNRAVGYTAMNDRSSRSHSCLTIYVEGTELTSCNTVRGRMHLVDLAGSERVDKSEVKGERLKEAQHINKSLSALGDVIASLAHKNAHIPYRNSKLTQLLQDSLGGQAKTLMFVHISPEADSLGETLSTLKFAERVATVELGAAKINKDNGEAKELKEQVAALRMELARKTTGKPLKPTISSTELRMKQNSASTSHLNDEDDEFSYPSSKRQPMEEVGNIEVRSESTRQKKSNYHAEELQLSMESPWPDSSLQLDEDYKEFPGSEGWVDKVVVNSMNRTNLEEEDANEQDLLRRFLNEMRVHPEQEVNSDLAGEKGGRELQTTRFDANSADIENNIRYLSEAEYLNLLNVPNILSAADASLSKLKRPQAKGTKGMDGRNSSHGHIPSSSGKLLNGSTPTLNRASRQLLSADGKRSNIKRNGKQ